MHCLYSLKLLPDFSYELKGGTSLSKGYGIIQRFSEDIDIRIPRVPGINHKKDIHTDKRLEYFEQLAQSIQLPGITSVERAPEFDDGVQMRHAGIRLVYPSQFNMLPNLKQGVLLEVGFGPIEPTELIDISSWAFDLAFENQIECIDNRAIEVSSYYPEYTFVEKLQAISTKYRIERENPDSLIPSNFLRHYYDVFCLLEIPRSTLFWQHYFVPGQMKRLTLEVLETF